MKALYMTGALIGLTLLTSAATNVKGLPCVWLAKDLIGMKVVSQQGDDLGKIEDVVVHPGGERSYAVLTFGGRMGMGDKLFAMPWSVLRTVEPDTTKKNSELSLVLPLDKERLKKAPGFDKKSWPIMANPDWTKDVDAFYVGDLNPNTANTKDAAARTSVITWRASELKGVDVRTPTGENLGEIKELAIDSNGRVCYAALSVGGFLGMGDRIVAVPWDSLTFSLAVDKGDNRRITLASTKKQLEDAPQFHEGKEKGAEMCDPKWIGRVYEYHSCPVYWNHTGDKEVMRSSKL
ncbi:MAG: PRC-barrel domain-containing protein [Planctomycetota bacterium]